MDKRRVELVSGFFAATVRPVFKRGEFAEDFLYRAAMFAISVVDWHVFYPGFMASVLA
jgi:hypothetical protein